MAAYKPVSSRDASDASRPLAGGGAGSAAHSGGGLAALLFSKAGIAAALVAVAIVATAAALAAPKPAAAGGGSAYLTAAASFVGADPQNSISGTVSFRQLKEGDAAVTVTVAVTSTGSATIAAGQHGLHIHTGNATGFGAAACTAAGAHYNPQGVAHGGPLSAVRHVGDLGNATVDASGSIGYSFTDSRISLRTGDVGNIVGRGVMLHAFADDGGVGSSSQQPGCGPPSDPNSLTCTSNTTGNAGARLACAAIIASISVDGGDGSGNSLRLLRGGA